MGAYYSGQNDMQAEADTLGTETNARRFYENVDKVFKGEISEREVIKIGKTPQILQDYGAKDLPITINQSTMYKIAYPKDYFGAKDQGHNLGIPSLKRLPSQIADPVAILKSKSQDNSLVLLTAWKDTNKYPVIVPLHLDKNSIIGMSNDIVSAYGKQNFNALLTDEKGNSTVLYTKNNEDIHQLLQSGLQLPGVVSDDTLINKIISQDGENVNNIVNWDINGAKGSGEYIGTVENNGKRFIRVKMQDGKTADIDEVFISGAEKSANTAEKSKADKKTSPRISKNQRRFFDMLSKAINTPIEFVDSIKSPSGQAANGAYVNGKIILAEDSDRPLIEVAKHEITHMLKVNAPKEYAAYESYAIEALKKNGRYDDLYREYSELYGTDNESAINEELAADATQMFLTDEAAINELAQENPRLAKKFLDCIRGFIEKIKSLFADGGIDEVTASFETEQMKNAEKLWIKAIAAAEQGQSGADNVKYSFRKTFKEQVREVLDGKDTGNNHIYVGETTSILKQLGLNDKPMLITIGHIKDISHKKEIGISKYHGLSEKTINKLPQILDYPAIVFDSFNEKNPDTVCILSEVTDDDGLPILVVIKPDGNGKYNNVRIDSNFILTMFGRNNPQGFLNAIGNNYEKILFADKKRTQALLRGNGLQLPKSFSNVEFNIIIHKSNNVVNNNLKNDTKYQLRRQESLERQNEKLRAINDSLREQFYLTEGIKVNRKQIDTAARKFLADIHSKADKSEFSERALPEKIDRKKL